MKSVCLAAWYLTIAFGNILVIIFTGRIDDQVYEYVFFAGLLFLATIIFSVLAYFYKYVEKPEVESNEKKKMNSVEPYETKEKN
jgi:hypothetical protein